MITYTEKGEITAYLKKLEKKRKFSGEETGQILLLANINNKYINGKDKEKIIEDIDFIKLLNKAEKSLNSENQRFIYDIYKSLHVALENNFCTSAELSMLCLTNLEAIYERIKLTYEIEYACCENNLEKSNYLYKRFSLDYLLKDNHNFTNRLQYESLAKTLRHILAYNEFLKILEKQYNIYNLYDCYKNADNRVLKKGIDDINVYINKMLSLLPYRKEEINKIFPLINLEVFKPSEENIKEVSEEIKEIGFNCYAINRFKYHFNDFINYLTIDCIDTWEKEENNYTYSSTELLNRINKIEVKINSEARKRNNK